MHRTGFIVWGLMFVLLLNGPTWAHHTSSSSRSCACLSATNLTGKRSLTGSSSHLSMAYTVVQLDESLGQKQTLLLSGEFDLVPRFVVGAGIPLIRVDHNFGGKASGVGDLNLYGRWRFFESAMLTLSWQSGFTLPSGSEARGLGLGSVATTQHLLVLAQAGKWNPYFMTGLGAELNDPWQSMMETQLGVHFPSFLKNRVRPYAGLAIQTHLHSDMFETGSTKVFAEPGVNVSLDSKQKFGLNLAAQMSVIDTLALKPGMSITGIDITLQSDMLFMGRVGLNYSF